jgi:hypothetical protein
MKVCLLDAMLPQLLPRLRAEILEAPGLRIRIRSNLSWIRIQAGKNDPPKIEKSTEFSCFEVLDVLFRGVEEGFSCSLGVLYGGLGISKLQFLVKKIKI